MAKDKVADANKTFGKAIQKALSTTGNVVWTRFTHPTKGDAVKLYMLPKPLTLKNASGLDVAILNAYIVTEVIGSKSDKHLKIREYIYEIAHPDPDDRKALYEFHWHPEKIDRTTLEPRKLESTDKMPFPHPHTHVRAKDNRFVDLNKRHLPSGRIAFEDVLSFLFREFEVAPEKSDWIEILAITRRELETKHKWL